MGHPPVPGGSGESSGQPVHSQQTQLTQLNTYRSYVTTFADPNVKEENKLKAAKELSENFEIIVNSPQYVSFLDHALKIFLRVLQDGEPHFIAENKMHQVRKLLLEMIYRLPTNKSLQPYVESILSVCLKLLKTENEQNVQVCLRIIIELHKYYRPPYSAETVHFLKFVKEIYRDLPEHTNKIFEPKAPLAVKDLSEVNFEAVLSETYTMTPIHCEKKSPEDPDHYNLIPKGVMSLKVLQELPIIVVLMYESYKDNVHQEVTDYIPVIINTITLQPSKAHRMSPSFNKEVFVDFMSAQIKTLSFLAYIIRIYQDVVGKHSQQMVEGMLGMLTLCPQEVTHLRKELLIAARHILATDLRLLFVPYMGQLLDEGVLLGRGWTTHESLRPLAYSTLADLVHHVRQQLPMPDLVNAVHLFAKNVHDETLPTSIQTISCKLLLNLVDCIRNQGEKDPSQAQVGQDLLMRMLEVFVVKFKTISKQQLPVLIAKSKAQPNQDAQKVTPQPVVPPPTKKEEVETLSDIPTVSTKIEEKDVPKSKFGLPASQAANYTVADCRSLVRTLVCGVKTITWRFKVTLFKPKETEMFIRLVKWALLALDIYTLSVAPAAAALGPGQRALPTQTVRTKEEKEVLEHFSGVFSVMDTQTFREIFSTTIEYMVERIASNFALQIVGNSFLTNRTTSPVFATVLVEYLLGRMEEMGSGNVDRSNLYLKLFKLVFGSVSLFPPENEHMLRPHLHQIVNRSMELAMTAKDPYNYFLLLRTLFRSIGGGNHDLLYQEFLPLLPNLLQGLNSLQSGLHKQHMKDLFVELCLTVPVRLSSLLPYLPMLMDPLVSALNGSHTLISQGLRTLELCVDNLQPDFLYEHIQPVRAELMQALWRSLRNPHEQVAHVAFRVLGKFGGGNRKMMIEPQKLEYCDRRAGGPAVVVQFTDQGHSGHPGHQGKGIVVELAAERAVEAAVGLLKPGPTDLFYRRQAWTLVRSFLVAALRLDDSVDMLAKFLTHPAFANPPLPASSTLHQPSHFRTIHVTALTGMFFYMIVKDVNLEEVQPVFEAIVRHYMIMAICQQAGPLAVGRRKVGGGGPGAGGMDPLVLVDALTTVMGHEDKDLVRPAKAALEIMLRTGETVLGSVDRTCRLGVMEYLAERMCALCYERAWYTKLGGCLGIALLYESMSLRWVYQHLLAMVKAQLFVMMDLTGEVSSGAIDQAKANLEGLVQLTAPACSAASIADDPELPLLQAKALTEVTHELIRQVTSPTDLLRHQSMHLLRVLATAQGKSVVQVMEPHKDVLVDMIPPKKHLLRHQAANAQIGLMEGNTFCTTLTPRLFSIDLQAMEHNVFFHEVMSLCEASDAGLLKQPSYKGLGSLLPLQRAAMRAVAACHYVPAPVADKIFNLLYDCLARPDPELQQAAFEAIQTFLARAHIETSRAHEHMRPTLLNILSDYRNLTLPKARQLSYLVQLFPLSFSEKLCQQLLDHLRKLFDALIQAQKGVTKSGETEQMVVTMLGVFSGMPAAGPRLVEPLVGLVLGAERALSVGPSSPFAGPLLRFLLRFPHDTTDHLLSDASLRSHAHAKFLEFALKHPDGKPFRVILQGPAGVERLAALATVNSPNAANPANSSTPPLTPEDKLELQYQSARVVSLLVKFDDQWISTQHQLANTFIQIWCNNDYLTRHVAIESVHYTHWKEPKLIVKILLNYFSHHPTNIDLLFQLLRAFTEHILPDFQFLRDFLDTTVAQSYTVEWKRAAFFRFVELFHSDSIAQELKAKILQLIIIPSFAVCFERGECDKLIGGPPAPHHDLPDNVVSVFINKVIDPDKPFGQGDSVRILVLQLSCLLVEQALDHIHDLATKTQGHKLRRLMTYAWPCLLSNNCVDPATRYHGHLLLSHIIAKFTIQNNPYKRIVLQVLHSLLKAHAVEVRPVVRQALEILIPAMPLRMDDGYKMLTFWTKKIIVEEGHSMQQLFHILQLIVRHYSVFYPVRHSLIQHMVTSLQRLGFSASSSIEHRRLAVELAEVIIRWELQRVKEANLAQDCGDAGQPGQPGQKRKWPEESEQPWKRGPGASPAPGSGTPASPAAPSTSASSSFKHDPDENKPVDRAAADSVLNFLARLCCQVNEATSGGNVGAVAVVGSSSPGEVLSRRCFTLIRMALKPDVWPQHTANLRLGWLDKTLASVDLPNPNLGNICIGLELLTFLITVMKRDQVLATAKPLQKGINACISSSNHKVIRLTHGLLTRLMNIFPHEPSTSDVSSKHEELECIYSSVGKVIFEGLANYEKNATATATSLFGTLMMLKAACASNPSYVDRLLNPFVRVIHRMSREHLTASGDAVPGTSELLILGLELVKNRVGVMTGDTKKTFIGSILVGLIEKTPDMKVMKSICKTVEDWMKTGKPAVVPGAPGAPGTPGPPSAATAPLNPSSSSSSHLGPSLREKSILLVKLMHYVEKRFPDLNTQFLELVHYVYSDEYLKTTELVPKLEPAFLAGLRCSQPTIRAKFFEIFDSSIKKRLLDRLMYIVSSQNWEPMGPHYWIKQCIELILVTADQNALIQLSSDTPLLHSVTSLINSADEQTKNELNSWLPIKELTEEDDDKGKVGVWTMVREQGLLLGEGGAGAETRTAAYLAALAQLCHLDTALAERTWLDLFPRIWAGLPERQRASLQQELLPFLVSGVHVCQKDIHPSALSTMFEAIAVCSPPLPIKPAVMAYLGKSHNLWHRVTLGLEQLYAEQLAASVHTKSRRDLDCYDFEPDPAVPYQVTFDYLVEMYTELKEEDMWAGLWTKHARYKETSIAIAYEQQGLFEKALGAYELVIGKGRQDYSAAPAPPGLATEQALWEQHWVRCTKELNQWDHLLDYAKTKNITNHLLILESAWRVPDWALMKDAIATVESACPKHLCWKVHLYRGFLAICHSEEQHLPIVERYVELASSLCMREWRRLPHIVSHIHLPLLQAAQQIMELQEACQIHQGLLHERNNSLHDMKAIVKTWRNRLPIIADDLSHWSDIFTWRQHHYQFITQHYDGQIDAKGTNHSMFGVHASAQAIIHFGKIARKHKLTGVCLDSLSRIYTIPSVPIVDCFQKIRQQVKCYLSWSSQVKEQLQEGLDVVESTNLKYFTKEMTSEFYALKGMLLAQIGRYEDANKAFSAAVMMHDTLVKAWALWGDFIEDQFTRAPVPNIKYGVCAITCFLHACRHQNESKSRKYLAKVLWLLTYDDEEYSLTEAVDKYVVGVPPVQWLPWVPQLLTCIMRNEGKLMLNLLSQVGRMFPQAVYLPIRTLYLTLKIEQRERYKSAEQAAKTSTKPLDPQQLQQQQQQAPQQTPQQGGGGAGGAGGAGGEGGGGPIRATPAMMRCCRIMHMQRDIHPTVLSSLEGLADQLVWLRESWYEEVLRQLRQGLAKCHLLAFEGRGAVVDATITPHTLHFVNKLISTFGLGVEAASVASSAAASAASDSLARRAEVTIQDPVFPVMKAQFSLDFDFTGPGAMKLQNLIGKLKKWIKILEAKTKLLPKSFLIEEKCRFLSNFSLQTAEIELPGEFLLPKHSHYYVRISRFMPRVEIVQKHNTAARRLYIRGHNGKIYPYLVINDSGLGDARREERVLQLLRMLNHYLAKQKETSRRFLHLTVPRVVAVSPQMRLVEDNPASISLFDIFKRWCSGSLGPLSAGPSSSSGPAGSGAAPTSCPPGADHDSPIQRYYERLAVVQARGVHTTHHNLKEILKDIQATLVPSNILKTWALNTYPSPTDYWTFRKMLTLQLSLACFCEYVLHLTRLNPDMMYIHQDSGLVNISYFRFDCDDTKGELDANRPVPFRLTPNLLELVTETGVAGPLTASMIAVARCLAHPNFKVPTILRAILRDEFIYSYKKRLEEEQEAPSTTQPDVPGEVVIKMVNHAVGSITQRLNSLVHFDDTESKVTTLVVAARSQDNLCRMDPAWHPWL